MLPELGPAVGFALGVDDGHGGLVLEAGGVAPIVLVAVAPDEAPVAPQAPSSQGPLAIAKSSSPRLNAGASNAMPGPTAISATDYPPQSFDGTTAIFVP